MTEASKHVFDRYHVRKTKKQKDGFIEYIKTYAEEKGYSIRVEKASFGARNVVIGSPESAKAVYTAHYDTCPRLPFPNFITPKNFFYYIVYQLIITVLLIAVIIAAASGLSLIVGVLAKLMWQNEEIAGSAISFTWTFGYFLVLYLLMNGPANKHTANDNTSGVITLLEIMDALPQEHREKIAFVFFDLEEMGLIGSQGFASKHKATMKDKLVLNFDCVSDGNNILFAVRKGASAYVPALSKAYVSNEAYNVDIAAKGVFYPSDQANFKAGVGVASLKYSKKLRTLYMDRIHTNRDVIFDEANIEFLTDGAIRLARDL